MSTPDELSAQLAAAGIAASYTDGLGRHQAVPESTLRRVLSLLNRTPVFSASAPAAGRCHLPDALARGERLWGLGVQLYTLRSARNWGIGDFTDLATLGQLAADVGADFLAVNPLHARSLARPELSSPYSPTSRLYLDPLYVDPQATEDYRECAALREEVDGERFQAWLADLRRRKHIDYGAVCRLKLDAFGALHRCFRERHVAHNTARAQSFVRFKTDGGETLRHYARFEAERLAAAQAGSADLDELADMHCYLQWIAEQQLSQVAQTLRAAGMCVGLYRDLALGPDRYGAEACDPAAGLLAEVSAGAPPDAFNPNGQCWDLAVYDPLALQAAGGLPFAELLRANMQHAGALRIDHVMGLQRLFWIIDDDGGQQGTYVGYPFELLMDLLCERSRASGSMVVGEDLGTVPSGFRDALSARDVLGCRVLWFEREEGGGFRAPAAFTRTAVVSATTHDLPTIVGFWAGQDIALRHALGIYDAPAEYEQALSERCAARAHLAAALGNDRIERCHIDEGHLPDDLCALVHAYLARTPAMLFQVQLDDVLEEREAVNLPGTNDQQHPNWRRKLSVALEDLAADRRFSALTTLDRHATT